MYVCVCGRLAAGWFTWLPREYAHKSCVLRSRALRPRLEEEDSPATSAMPAMLTHMHAAQRVRTREATQAKVNLGSLAQTWVNLGNLDTFPKFGIPSERREGR